MTGQRVKNEWGFESFPHPCVKSRGHDDEHDFQPVRPTAEEISSRAWYALDDHKSTCTRCGDAAYQMCETGRGLQHHLWDCQAAAHTASLPNRPTED